VSEEGNVSAVNADAVWIRVDRAEGSSLDALRSLQAWIAGEQELSGRVRHIPEEPPAGAMGGASAALAVALGPGGIATAAATVLLAWIRRRTGSVKVTLQRPDGTSWSLETENVQGLTASELRSLTRDVAAMMDGGNAPGDT
jgi:Effector Associated Constant Component 1